MTPRGLGSLVMLAALGGCAVGPDYHPAPPAALSVPDQWSVPARAEPGQIDRWWNQFQDPILDDLVARAAAGNLDLAQAIARLRQGRESLVVSRSAFLPSLSGSGGYSRSETLRGGGQTVTLPDGSVINTGSSGGTSNFSIGLDASYQADLFGGVRRSVEASRAQFEASGYDQATTLLSVQSEVATNYVLARAYQAQLDNARQSLAIQDENLQIAQWRVQAGLVSSFDVEQARASRAQTAAEIPQLEQQYNGAVSRIGVLIGEAPGAFKAVLQAPRPIPRGADTLALGIPADLLRQRPDVRSAERNLAAAVAQIGINQAQLYPSLSISGSLDTRAISTGTLLDTITGNLFAGLAQTIFSGGRLRAQVRASRAAADGAFAAYKQTVLLALEDVETASVALDAARRREAQFAIAFEAANNSAILARSQYRAGLTDFNTLNTQEAALVSARNGVVQARSDEATALISLYVALGGGWDAAADPTTPLVPSTGPYG
jgi:NodT family efflux transporter outer membrane factor (OMF) lipoprotein